MVGVASVVVAVVVALGAVLCNTAVVPAVVVEEKHEDSSFVQTTTMTQADFSDGDSLPSWASSVLPDITAVSSKVAVPRTPQNMVDRTPCTSNKTSNRQEEKRERELQEKENSQD